MFCVKCGQELVDDAAFCVKCGAAVPVEATQRQTVMPQKSSQDASDPQRMPTRPQVAKTSDVLQAEHMQSVATHSHGVPIAIACAVVAVVAAVVVIVLSAQPQSQPTAQNPNQAVSSQTSSPSAQDTGRSEKEQAQTSEENAQRKAEEQAQREAEERATRYEAELQAAYNANPTIVYAAPSKMSDFVTLTGTIDVQQGFDRGAQRNEDVCMLVLPAEITVSGTQYGEQSSNIIILSNDFARYAGQVVTMQLKLGVRATASIASAEFSMLQGGSASVQRVWDANESTAVEGNAATREQIAVDATMALLTTANHDGNNYYPVTCEVAQYLAPGSAAEAEYSRGWNPDYSHEAKSAEVEVANGDHYQMKAEMLSFRPDTGSGSAKIHIATAYLTFDENNKITDIDVKVV